MTAPSQIWVQEVKMTAPSQIWVQEVKMTAPSQIWVQEVKMTVQILANFWNTDGLPKKEVKFQAFQPPAQKIISLP